MRLLDKVRDYLAPKPGPVPDFFLPRPMPHGGAPRSPSRLARALGLARSPSSSRTRFSPEYHVGLSGGPDLNEVLRSNFNGLQAGPWQRIVQADWLGPYTPHRVQAWVLKIMREDPQIKLGINAIRAPFFGISYRLKGGNPATRAFVEKTLLHTPLFDPLLKSILKSLDFGFAPHEVLWDVGDVEHDDLPGGSMPRAFTVKGFSDLDPERCQLQIDDFGRFAGLMFDGTQHLPADMCVLATHELEFRNYYGTSHLKAAYNPFYWTSWLYLYLMRYQETKVNPPLIGTAPWDPRTDEDDQRGVVPARNAMAVLGQQMLNLRNGSVASLPSELDEKTGTPKWGIKILEDSGRTEQFLTAINHMQALKLRALCVPERTATQDTETGSFAMVKEHVDIFLMILEGIKRTTVIPPLNRCAELLVKTNFGRSAPIPYFVGSDLARQNKALMFELVKQAMSVPLTLKDGRSYRPEQLIDFTEAFESFNMAIRHPEEVAQFGMLPADTATGSATPAPGKDPKTPGAPPPPVKAPKPPPVSAGLAREAVAPSPTAFTFMHTFNMPEQKAPVNNITVEPAAVTNAISVAPARVDVQAPIMLMPDIHVPAPIVNLGDTHTHVTMQAPPAGRKDATMTFNKGPDGLISATIKAQE